MKKAATIKFKSFIQENKYILIVMIVLFAVRLLAMLNLGVTYNLGSDDTSYVLSGITLKNTGILTMHEVVSAQIMPGMSVIIALVSIVFGEGKIFWLALKLIWITMGCLSAFMSYKCVKLFVPKWCAIITALLFLRPDFIWMDNIILTETPFMLCLITMVYATFMMGKTYEKKYFILCLTMYMSALMFKANIGIYPIFAFIYLLLVKYDFKLLIKQGIIIGITLMIFIVPWSIRNYSIYHKFIPLTYGAGNPKLLGTYQGIGYPLDENLNYKENVDDIIKEKYNNYYDQNGKIQDPIMKKYISLEADGVKAKYRLKEWWKSNPASLIYSYVVIKPMNMVKSVFYWDEIFGINKILIENINFIEWIVCILGVFTSTMLRKNIKEMLLLAMVYSGNIFVYAMTFSFDRYAATLAPMRFISIGIGLGLIFKLWKYGKKIGNENY
ncbi:ArnT family glycosyltransferase [Paraclostridium sordellii]|uniref:ArnT family glycosyltransferase n=1 Tax=Paraclostridium sordellii TaxID=1505 RepID=UPI0005DE22B4|nr:glycosyltransferase family 39 protein [Paeniclostridium sordellii]CEN26687.1 dolichyl-phosphate-mannose-protein mannosyltransferase family protein [[Clostridium] sordellii] [Paeniclostridium sordellii]